MSKIKVNEISTLTGSDITITTGKTLTGTASQFKITGGTAGQALITDGSGGISFGAVDSLPTQSGNADKFLKTDGTTATWETVSHDPTMGGDMSGTASNAQIAAGAVGATEIAAGAVGIDELSATGTASSSTFLRGDNAWVASGLAWQAVVTAATTMVAGRGYFVNTTGSAFSMTLPGSATIGDEVHIIDYAGTFDTNNCTVARNSHKILGATSDLVVATERAAFKLVYVDATQGWLLTEL